MFDFTPSGGPSREQKFNVSDDKTTPLLFESLEPEKQYYAEINTGNEFGESPSIFETIPKDSGSKLRSLTPVMIFYTYIVLC